MTRRRWALGDRTPTGVGCLVAGLAALVLVCGCSSPTSGPATSATPATTMVTSVDLTRACADAAAALVAAVGRAVAGYDEPRASAGPQPASTAGVSTATSTTRATGSGSADPSGDLGAAVTAAKSAIARFGCASSTFRADVDAGLKAVETHTPIAAAVLARLAASITGRVGQQPETRRLTPTDDIAQTVAQLAPGSTVLLDSGTYAVKESLVLLEGLTLRGSGRDGTVLKASAPDAAVVVMTPGQVEVSDLRIELDASVPASGIVAAPQSALKLTSIGISGAKATSSGVGGAGVQMSGSATDNPARTTTLEVTDASFDRNAWAGIAVGGGHRASILRASFADNGQCGVCFLDTSSGSVQDSRFTGDPVALGANGQSRPTWVGNAVTGGTVGVQLDGNAAPTIQDLTVTGASRAAVIFSGRSGGAIANATCASVPYGIVVADTAAPTIGKVACAVARGG